MTDPADPTLLGASEVRALATRHGIRPTKQWGQNFVIDANTVRRIVRVSGVGPDDVVVEVGPGLGSLTLALLPAVRRVVALEVDPTLADALPGHRGGARARARRPSRGRARRRAAVTEVPGPAPTALVANLPYNVSVPVAPQHARAAARRCTSVLVMVQVEVADRLAAPPGSRTYGVPSVKAAWYADVRLAAERSRNVFWPVPNVDSGLVAWTRREPPVTTASREQVFAVIDAAFAQRRKTLRAALATLGRLAPRPPRRPSTQPGWTRARAASMLDVDAVRPHRRRPRLSLSRRLCGRVAPHVRNPAAV